MVLWFCLSTWMGKGAGSCGGFLGQSYSRRLSEHLQGRPEKVQVHWQNCACSWAEEICCQ